MKTSFDISNKADPRRNRISAGAEAVTLLVLEKPPARAWRWGAFALALCVTAAVLFVLTFAAGSHAIARETPAMTKAGSDAPLSKKARKMQDDEPLGIALSEGSHVSELKPAGGASDAARKAEKDDQAAAEAPVKKTNRAKIAVKTVSAPKKNAQAKPTKAAKVKKTESKKEQAKPVQPPAPVIEKLADPDAVIAETRADLKKNPKDRAVLAKLVYALDQKGDDASLEILDELSDRYPSIASVHAARARILVRQNDTVEALSAWKRAVSLDRDNKDYKLGLAILTDRMGREAEALNLYRDVPGDIAPDVRKRMDYLSSRAAEQP